MKPKTQDISYFFKFHPYQPKDPFALFTSNKIVFRENGTNRIWLTFDESSKKLLLSLLGVCFRTKHIYQRNVWLEAYNQRINEHENSIVHLRSSESYFLKTANKDIDSLLFSNLNNIAKQNIKKIDKYLKELFR